MKNTMLIFALTLVVACSGSPTEPLPAASDLQLGAVRLRAELTSRTSVLLTLENDSAGEVGYNLCTSAMERRSGESWVQVPSDGVCTMELRLLAPGARATFTRTISAELPAGEYRFVTPIEKPLGSQHERIASNTITIS